MRIVTANIGRKSSVAGVWADVRRLRGAAPSAIIGWQEIDEADPADEHSILKNVLAKANVLVGMRTKVPISVPRSRYRILSKKVIYAAKGIPNISPTRWITEVEVQDKKNPAIRFVVLNMHYPAGAWNAKTQERHEDLRDEAWNDMFRVHKARVKHWAEKGVTLFWMGDVNRMAMPKAHPDERQVVTQGIDSISFIPANVRVRILRAGSINLNSDHNGHWVDFELSA